MRIQIFCLAVLFVSIAVGQKYTGPKCLGPYCIDRDLALENLLQRLGHPPRRNSPFLPYCYQSADRKVFLYVTSSQGVHPTADGVFIGDFPGCLHLPTTTTSDDLTQWKTPEGIGLGSIEDDVLQNYGRPASEEKVGPKTVIGGYRWKGKPPDLGEKILLYTVGPAMADLSMAQFGIRKGKVSFIWLSYRE